MNKHDPHDIDQAKANVNELADLLTVFRCGRDVMDEHISRCWDQPKIDVYQRLNETIETKLTAALEDAVAARDTLEMAQAAYNPDTSIYTLKPASALDIDPPEKLRKATYEVQNDLRDLIDSMKNKAWEGGYVLWDAAREIVAEAWRAINAIQEIRENIGEISTDWLFLRLDQISFTVGDLWEEALEMGATDDPVPNAQNRVAASEPEPKTPNNGAYTGTPYVSLDYDSSDTESNDSNATITPNKPGKVYVAKKKKSKPKRKTW